MAAGPERGPEHRLTMRIGRLEHLFTAPPVEPFPGSGILVPGVEEVVGRLRAVRLRGRVHLTISVEDDDVQPEDEARVRDAIVRYCDRRIPHVDAQRLAVRRDGLSALPIGLAILAVGLVASELLRHSGLPDVITEFVADGLFLVVAWVALWYPLDALLYYWRPHEQELRALRAMREMDVEVVQAPVP